MLLTKCILAPRDPADGMRISIMSRHTLQDGVTPDSRISPNSYDIWLPIMAPPPKLIGDYYIRQLPFEQYAQHYLEHLDKVHRAVMDLAYLAVRKNITLLCIEKTPKLCHRRLLAERCARLVPELKIDLC